MKYINVAKAKGIGSEAVEPVNILINLDIPELPELSDCAKFYNQQADQILNALKYSLPGGVFDRLLAKMMLDSASLLAIPLFEE